MVPRALGEAAKEGLGSSLMGDMADMVNDESDGDEWTDDEAEDMEEPMDLEERLERLLRHRMSMWWMQGSISTANVGRRPACHR